MIKNFIRALRLPFISASVIPFVFGSLIERQNFYLFGFLLGFIAAVATHLSANLINDYADSRTGADWQDKKFYKFFGGSKLIQENILSEQFYLYSAIICAFISILSVILLALNLNSFKVIIYYFIIIFLGWSYSAKPLQLSYRKWGEVVIFVLFGPALVMGAYFIQTGIFPDLRSFSLSVPFGLLTTMILFANEIPDFSDDLIVSKFNLVSITGLEKAFIIYLSLAFCLFLSLILNVLLGFLNLAAFFAFVFILLPIKSANIIRLNFNHKIKLVQSSKLTIALQGLTGCVLILSLLI